MEDHRPPFHITNRMLQLVSSISEKVGRLSFLEHSEALPHLRRNNRIRSIHSSLKIEANSLSLAQVRDVIGGKPVLGEQKEFAYIPLESQIEKFQEDYSAMEFGVPYTSAAIMAKLGLRSKETFRKHYLNPAIKLHLVEMTIPDKPTSKNQRYYKP